ncbi:MAG: tetratricopeptide repeat protein [Deltaproteobacteria bacterium]|nr:tetratricopeptide repeat protein [Deltaproteobacteria bacterium]
MRGFVPLLLTLIFADFGLPTSGDATEAGGQPSEWRGVVVETVGLGSNLEKAGLQPGDHLLSWLRLPNPPANSEEASGEIESFFDWKWLVTEQAPRGAVELMGERAGERKVFTVPMGSWKSEVRPSMPAKLLADYLKGRELIEASEFDQAEEEWLELGKLLEETVDWRLACGLFLRMGEIWAETRDWERARTEYALALELAGDRRSRAAIRYAIGESYEPQGHYEEAYKAIHTAFELQEEENCQSLEVAKSLVMLGFLANQKRDLETAMTHLHRALAIWEQLAPNSLGLSGNLNMLGHIAYVRRDLVRATQHHKQALAIQGQADPNSLDFSGSLLQLGWVSEAAGSLDEAKEYYQKALESYELTAPIGPEVFQNLNLLGRIAYKKDELKEATEYYQRALAIQEQLVPDRFIALSLERLGKMALHRSDIDAATEYHQRALVIQKQLSPDSLEVARTLGNLGKVALHRSDVVAATKYHQGALVIRKQLSPNSLEVAQTLGNLGKVALHRRDAVAATEFHQRALVIQKQLSPDSLEVARTLGNLGKVALHRRDAVAATKFHQRALVIQKQLSPNSFPVARSLWSLGLVASDRGDLDDATEYFQRALKIQEQLLPISFDLARSLASLASVAHKRGDLVAATEYHHRALAIRSQLSPTSFDVARSLRSLGAVANDRRDLGDAAEHYQRALVIQKLLAPNTLATANNLFLLGWVAEQRGDLDDATEYYQQTLAIEEDKLPANGGTGLWRTLQGLQRVAERSGDSGAEAKFRQWSLDLGEQAAPNSLMASFMLGYLGFEAFERRELTSAREYLQQSLAILQRLRPASRLVATILRGLGIVTVQSGDLEQAKEYILAELEIWERLSPGSSDRADTLEQLALALHKAKQPAESLRYYFRSLSALENQLRTLGGTETAKANFRARHEGKYRGTIELLLELSRPDGALGVLERSRARSFLSLLAERDLRLSTEVPEELDEARSRLTISHDRTLRQLESLNPEQDSERHLELTKQLRSLRREYEENAEAIKRSSPRLAALQYPDPLNLEEVQESLDPGTLMLSYSVGEEQVDVFAVSKAGGLQVETIPFGETQLRKKVESFLELIEETNQPGTDWGMAQLAILQELGQYLYGRLISPVEDLVGHSERLLILPDGPLHRLPFGALVRPLAKGESDTERDWQYLIEWKPLHEALSATVFAELKKLRPPAGAEVGEASVQISAFGDPTYPESTEELPEVGNLKAARARSAFRGCGFKHEALPHTRREIEEIAALYPETRSYLAGEATEEAAKALGPDTQIVHLAAHGCVDDKFPLNSAVVLSMPEGFPEDRDNGLLQVWEIFERVRLKADLVVLSACQSGLGKELRGEGLIGLTRAFQYAGARTVAASLWKVDDEVTAELMVRFYRHLKSGKTKDEALRAAQMELIREPVLLEGGDGQTVERDASSPYYWAAFQLFGDWL